jgi:hypothetical protein
MKTITDLLLLSMKSIIVFSQSKHCCSSVSCDVVASSPSRNGPIQFYLLKPDSLINNPRGISFCDLFFIVSTWFEKPKLAFRETGVHWAQIGSLFSNDAFA